MVTRVRDPIQRRVVELHQPSIGDLLGPQKVDYLELCEPLEMLCFVLICAQYECERKTEAPTHVSIDALLWRATAFGL